MLMTQEQEIKRLRVKLQRQIAKTRKLELQNLVLRNRLTDQMDHIEVAEDLLSKKEIVYYS